MNSEPNSPVSIPTHEKISSRARQRWENAGSPADRDLEFWLAAESSVRGEREVAPRPVLAASGPLPPKRAANRRR